MRATYAVVFVVAFGFVFVPDFVVDFVADFVVDLAAVLLAAAFFGFADGLAVLAVFWPVAAFWPVAVFLLADWPVFAPPLRVVFG